MKNLDAQIGLLQDTIAEEIISPPCWKKIKKTASMFSADITSFFGFERRMNKRDGAVDFLFHITPATGGEIVLRNDIELKSYAERSPAWACLRSFSNLWNDKDSALRRGGDNIWLEFDIADVDEKRLSPDPNLFFGPDQAYCGRLGYKWILDEVLPAISGSPLHSPIADRIERVFRDLPSGASIFQIGTMLARPTRFIRFCARGIAPTGISAYLNTLGWEDPSGKLEQLLLCYGPLSDRIDCDFDLVDRGGVLGIGSKIGLECYITSDDHYFQRWGALLGRITEEGLCYGALRDELLYCPGFVDMTAKNRKRWPTNLVECDAYFSPGRTLSLGKFLHHVKIVYDRDGGASSVEAKAYMAVTVFWRPNGSDTVAKKVLRASLAPELSGKTLAQYFRTEIPKDARGG